jgi:cytidine deaminase
MRNSVNGCSTAIAFGLLLATTAEAHRMGSTEVREHLARRLDDRQPYRVSRQQMEQLAHETGWTRAELLRPLHTLIPRFRWPEALINPKPLATTTALARDGDALLGHHLQIMKLRADGPTAYRTEGRNSQGTVHAEDVVVAQAKAQGLDLTLMDTGGEVSCGNCLQVQADVWGPELSAVLDLKQVQRFADEGYMDLAAAALQRPLVAREAGTRERSKWGHVPALTMVAKRGDRQTLRWLLQRSADIRQPSLIHGDQLEPRDVLFEVPWRMLIPGHVLARSNYESGFDGRRAEFTGDPGDVFRPLAQAALRNFDRAHVPRSGNPSALALETRSGEIVVGSPVESYRGVTPLGSALAALAAAKQLPQDIRRAVLVEVDGAKTLYGDGDWRQDETLTQLREIAPHLEQHGDPGPLRPENYRRVLVRAP